MAHAGPIPIVDLSPCVFRGSTKQRQEVAKKICDAFRTVGIVYLKNHGVPTEQVEAVLHITKKFFMLPPEVKHKYARPPSGSNHGWVCVGRESLNPERPGDYKEAYNATTQSVNNWPNDEVAGFQDVIMNFYDSCGRLAHLVMELIAQGLGLSVHEFIKCHSFNTPDINTTTVRSSYYPPLPENSGFYGATVEVCEWISDLFPHLTQDVITYPCWDESHNKRPDILQTTYSNLKVDQVRCGEHSDYGTLSLLFQDNVGGLEVRNRDGQYIPVSPVEGTAVVNIGDLMQRWTSDTLVSAKHRVVAHPEELCRRQARQSLAFFCHPDEDYIIRCDDGSDRYEPISTIDYLNMRFAATY